MRLPAQRRARALVAAAALLVAQLGGGAVRAEPSPEDRARVHYEEGKRHYDLAEYGPAIRSWREAYRISKAPLLLFDIGQAYRLDGNCEQALRFYENYRREERNPANRAQVDEVVAECEQKLRRGEVDDHDDSRASPSLPEAMPGPLSPPPEASRGRPGRGKRVVGVVTVGAGLLLTGTGAYFGLQARDAALQVEGHIGPWNDQIQAIERRGQRDDELAVGFLIGGGAAILTGGVLWYLGYRDQSRVTVAPTLSAGGDSAGVVWTIAF